MLQALELRFSVWNLVRSLSGTKKQTNNVCALVQATQKHSTHSLKIVFQKSDTKERREADGGQLGDR